MKIKSFLFALCLIVFAACSGSVDKKDNIEQEGCYEGTVTVILQDTSVDNNNIRVDYISEGETASIKIKKIRFVPAMPEIDVTVPNIRITNQDDGRASLSCDNVIPLALGGEFPKYIVHNFQGAVGNGTLTFSLSFGDYPTSFTGVLISN